MSSGVILVLGKGGSEILAHGVRSTWPQGSSEAGFSTGQKEKYCTLISRFISHSLNTEFEHMGMNTGVCHWALKRAGAELCSDLCSKQKKKQLRFDS